MLNMQNKSFKKSSAVFPKIFSLFLFFAICFCSLIRISEAAITLRVVAVNPADNEQTVPVKVYLPVETKPEDILNKEDLEVFFDIDKYNL